MNVNNKIMFLNEGEQCGLDGNKVFTSKNNNFPNLTIIDDEEFIGFGCSCDDSSKKGYCNNKQNSHDWVCECSD